jgi:hypothetical protein
MAMGGMTISTNHASTLAALSAASPAKNDAFAASGADNAPNATGSRHAHFNGSVDMGVFAIAIGRTNRAASINRIFPVRQTALTSASIDAHYFGTAVIRKN